MSNQDQDSDSDKPFVYVDLYIMLGDADGSIRGQRVIPRAKWEQEVKDFMEFTGGSATREDEHFGEYEVTLDNYKVKGCTAEEAKTLEKFLKKDYGFRWPSEFVD
jgi:hypothetical protein